MCGYLDVQSCLTLFDAMDYSPPGSSVHGILQTRRLEWVAISFFRDLPDPGIEPTSPEFPALQADALPSEPPGNQFFESGGRKIGVSASASVLPMNIQD